MSESTDQPPTPATAWDANRIDTPTTAKPVLLPLFEGTASEHTIELARAIAAGNDVELLVLNTVTVPEQTPLTLPDTHLIPHWQATHDTVTTIEQRDTTLSVTGHVHVGHRRSHIISAAAHTYNIGTTVWDDAHTTSRLSPITRTPVEKLLATTASPIAVPNRTPLPDSINSILVPIAGGPHSPTATTIAGSIARAHNAWIDLLHVITDDTPDQRDQARTQLAAAKTRLADTDHVDTWLLEADTVADTIIEQSQYYDATVIGAPRTHRLRRFLLGSTARTIQEHTDRSLITVWQ